MSLHEACYEGLVEVVRGLLRDGSDPNALAMPGARAWVSSEGPAPRPLNCVAIAWALGPEHVAVARLLLEHGAVVTESVLRDLAAEGVGSDAERDLHDLLVHFARHGSAPPAR